MNIRPDDHLLNDLLDGRLASDEAAALRSRLEAEPELMERYTELAQVGELMRTWDPAAALEAPDTLSASVRAAVTSAGAALRSDPTDTSSNGQAADGASGDGDSPAEGTAGRGRMFRLISYAYAAAAVLVLGVTLAVTLSDDPKPNTLTSEQTHGEVDLAVDTEKQARSGAVDAPDAGSRAQPRPLPAKRPGHFGPSGAVPPGLREPADPVPPARTESKPRASGHSRPGAAGGVSAPGRAEPRGDAKEFESARDKLEKVDQLREFAARAPVTYMLEVKDTAGVRAQLSLLVAALEREEETGAVLRSEEQEKGSTDRDPSVGGGAKDESPTKRARRGAEPTAQAQLGSAEGVVEALRAKGARFYRTVSNVVEPTPADEQARKASPLNGTPAKPAAPASPDAPPAAAPTTPAAPGSGPAEEAAEGADAPRDGSPKSDLDDRESLHAEREEIIEIRLTPEALARLEELTSKAGQWAGQAEPAQSTPRSAPAAKATGGEPPVGGRPPASDSTARRKKKSDGAEERAVVVRIVLVRRK